MTKKIISIFIISLIISSCETFSKVNPLINFSKKVNVEKAGKISNFSKSGKVDFSCNANFVNNSIFPFNISNNFNSELKLFSIGKNAILSAPIVKDDFMYFVDVKGNIVKYDLSNKKVVWSLKESQGKSDPIYATIIHSDSKIFATIDKDIFVLDSETGKEIINLSAGDLIKVQPLVKSNLLAIQTAGNELHAFNTENWSMAWISQSWDESVSTTINYAPIFFDSRIITSYSSGMINSLNAYNGQILWSFNQNIDSQSDSNFIPSNFTCQPLFDNNYLYVASSNGKFMKINIDTGLTVYIENYDDIHSMSMAGNYIFFTNNARQLVAISKDTGKPIWAANLYSKKSENEIEDTTSFLTPIVTLDKIYVASNDGYIFEVSLSDGSVLNKISIPKNIDNFIIWNNKLYIVKGSNLLSFL